MTVQQNIPQVPDNTTTLVEGSIDISGSVMCIGTTTSVWGDLAGPSVAQCVDD